VGEGVLIARPQDVTIAFDAVRTDVAAFDAAAASDNVGVALALYRGDFLPELTLPSLIEFEHWLDAMRSRLRRRAVELARNHARHQAVRGEAVAAIATLECAFAWDPANESVGRDLIAMLAQAGDTSRALAEYKRMERALTIQLDTTPALETRALAERVRAHRPIPAFPDDAPAETVTAGRGAGWPHAIAVLPFANLSGNPEQDYFADGMTEALITELARRSHCRVISRQSVLGYRGSRQSLQEIARALDVDAVIEGSVIRNGEHVRVTAQLVRVEPEAHLWADTFDRTVPDILALHSDVARAIVDAFHACANGSGAATVGGNGRAADLVHAEFGGAERRAVDPLAYEAYLKGRHFSLRPPQMDRAIAHYRMAIERDPEHAPSWAGLAAVYANLTLFAYLSPADAFPKLRHAMEQALALDPELGDAIAMRGMYRMLADRDWAGARTDFLAAVENSPQGLETRLALGLFLAAMGEFDAALTHLRSAAMLDPLGPATRFTLAWCLYRARQHRASIHELETILELHPEFALAYPYVGLNCALLGKAEPAQEAARRGIERLPDDHETLALGAAVFGLTGSEQEGQDAFDRLVAIGSKRYLDPWAVGAACTGLGNLDTAAQWFRRMYDERSPSAFCVRHDPLLDPLHEHPVFRDVLRRLAFPPLKSRS
jgi:TolB-like protein/Tfp pilus assembly protein PilF